MILSSSVRGLGARTPVCASAIFSLLSTQHWVFCVHFNTLFICSGISVILVQTNFLLELIWTICFKEFFSSFLENMCLKDNFRRISLCFSLIIGAMPTTAFFKIQNPMTANELQRPQIYRRNMINNTTEY